MAGLEKPKVEEVLGDLKPLRTQFLGELFCTNDICIAQFHLVFMRCLGGAGSSSPLEKGIGVSEKLREKTV